MRYVSFKQWCSPRLAWQGPGTPKCLLFPITQFAKDQDTLIEQSNILLKQSVTTLHGKILAGKIGKLLTICKIFTRQCLHIYGEILSYQNSDGKSSWLPDPNGELSKVVPSSSIEAILIQLYMRRWRNVRYMDHTFHLLQHRSIPLVKELLKTEPLQHFVISYAKIFPDLPLKEMAVRIIIIQSSLKTSLMMVVQIQANC